ncbi:MAG TPA: EF-hand domain-containing protein [Williamwhitmania sp.]|nr:EF-hand domain-containing protein [Williamwhitmania sp.]
MRSFRKGLIFALFALVVIPSLKAQDDELINWESYLTTEVEVIDPVYRPVVGFGVGVLNFYGDVNNSHGNLLVGTPAYRVSVMVPLGKTQDYKLNFFALIGNLQGFDRQMSYQLQRDNPGFVGNTSFNTNFTQFGINIEYNFGSLFRWKGVKVKKGTKLKVLDRTFRPFISIGIAPFQYTAMGNLTHFDSESGTQVPYYFWSDGTIRNIAQTSPLAPTSKIIQMDGSYETNLQKANLYGSKNSQQTALSIPMDFGLDFFLNYRINVRVGTSLTYTFSDLLDNVDAKAAKNMVGLKSNGRNDMFTYTYVSIHLDLFSDPETKKVTDLFKMVDDFDYDAISDADVDGVLDLFDQCPDTPLRVAVDSVGCPLDSDKDGVPDYLDKEPNTPRGAMVDDNGVTLSDSSFAKYNVEGLAVNRDKAITLPVNKIWTRSVKFEPGVVPEKFKSIDTNGDGYIDYNEMMNEINKFFDGDSKLKTDDIYELNEFFFDQQ